MIELTDGDGQKRTIDPEGIEIVYFSKFISAKGNHSDLILNGHIRAFVETPDEVVAKIGDTIKLIPLHFRIELDDRVWVNKKSIEEVTASPTGHGCTIKFHTLGSIRVREDKVLVDAARA